MFSNKIKRYRAFIKLSAVLIIIVLGVHVVSSVKFFSEIKELKTVDESEFKEEYPGRIYTLSITSTGSEVKIHPSISQMRLTLTDGKWEMYPVASSVESEQLSQQAYENDYSTKALFIYTHLFNYIFLGLPIALILALTLVFLRNTYKDNTPFTIKSANLLKIISCIVLIYGAFGKSVVAGFVYKWVFNTDWFGARMEDADLIIIAFGILLLMVSFAFSYGVYLQEEFDDTV